MKTQDLKVGWLIETVESGLQMVVPINDDGIETIALVDSLKRGLCQTLHDYDVFKEETVLKVYGLPMQECNRCWLEISTLYRPIMWVRTFE